MKCTKFFNAYNCSFKNHVLLRNQCTIVLMYLIALSIISCVNATYRYHSIISNINLNTCFFDNCIDNLTTLYLQHHQSYQDQSGSGSIFGAYSPTSLRGSAIAGFIQVSIMNSLASLVLAIAPSTIGSCKTVNLNIHLNSCDTFCCTCYLKVHITEEIFKSLNIC